jgi:hypothetical protein
VLDANQTDRNIVPHRFPAGINRRPQPAACSMERSGAMPIPAIL